MTNDQENQENDGSTVGGGDNPKDARGPKALAMIVPVCVVSQPVLHLRQCCIKPQHKVPDTIHPHPASQVASVHSLSPEST